MHYSLFIGWDLYALGTAATALIALLALQLDLLGSSATSPVRQAKFLLQLDISWRDAFGLSQRPRAG